MKCPHCQVDLSTQETITAIKGELKCNKCAVKMHTESELFDYAEEVVPLDIGILPECAWCKEEFEESELTETALGKLCSKCIAAIKSCGKEL